MSVTAMAILSTLFVLMCIVLIFFAGYFCKVFFDATEYDEIHITISKEDKSNEDKQ